MKVREFLDKFVATICPISVRVRTENGNMIELFNGTVSDLVGFKIFDNADDFTETFEKLQIPWLDCEVLCIVPTIEFSVCIVIK